MSSRALDALPGLDLQIVDVEACQVKSLTERNFLDWQNKLRLNQWNLEEHRNYAPLEPHAIDRAATFVVRIWCRSEQGESVCLLVCDATKHLYQQLRPQALDPRTRDGLTREVKALLFEKTQGLAKFEIVHKYTTQGWRCDPEDPNTALRLPWLKFSVCSAWQAKMIKDASKSDESWLQEVARRMGRRVYDLFSIETAHWKLDPRTEVLQAIGARAGGWLRLSPEMQRGLQRGDNMELLCCSALLQVRTADLVGAALPEKMAMAPLRVLSFDIECVSRDDAFPNAELPDDYVICIGLYCKALGAPEASATCTMLCLQDTGDVPESSCPTSVRSFCSEEELLQAFQQELCNLDADVVAGYNTCLFDWRYLAKRAQRLGQGGRGLQQFFARHEKLPTPPREQTLSSGAVGDNPLCYPRMPGRVNFDLWLYLKRENISGLENLKLDTISKHFLNDSKHDLPAKEMFKAYRAGPQGRAQVADYCRQDCKLVLDLLEKLEALPNVWEMAKITCTTPEDILFRGQQIKVYTQLVLKALECEYLVEDRLEVSREEGEEEESFQGATVVSPTPGYYLEPIFCLDFASLYPSLMRTKNLSPDCLITPQLSEALERKAPGKVLSNDVRISGGVVHRFIRNSVHEGLLPRILAQLLSERKRVKKLMEKEPDPKVRALLNNKQLALKISANSVYGSSGSTRGKLSFRECAEATTAAGREAIDFTCNFVNKLPGYEIIYGDTDSAFTRVPEAMRSLPVEELFARGEALAEEVTAAIEELMPGEKCFIKLEFEKVFLPLVLYKKKRYAGLCIEDPSKPAKTMAKGLELVRRDACQLVKVAQRRVIDLLLHQRDVEEAARTVVEALKQVLEIPAGGPFDLVKQSKSLRSSYQDETSQVHCVVRSLMREREPGSEPQVGDRVEFVVVASHSARVVDKCEDVKFAEKQLLPPDWLHYLESVERPMRAILEVPLEHTKPQLLKELLGATASLKARAKAMVARSCMARQGATWSPGKLLKDGGVQRSLFSVLEPTRPPRLPAASEPQAPSSASRVREDSLRKDRGAASSESTRSAPPEASKASRQAPALSQASKRAKVQGGAPGSEGVPRKSFLGAEVVTRRCRGSIS